MFELVKMIALKSDNGLISTEDAKNIISNSPLNPYVPKDYSFADVFRLLEKRGWIAKSGNWILILDWDEYWKNLYNKTSLSEKESINSKSV